MTCCRQTVDSRLLAGVPSLFLVCSACEYLAVQLVALRVYEFRHTFAELCTQLLNGYVGILNGVMQSSCCQQFLVGSDGSNDLHRLHRVNDIRESFAATLGVVVRFDREHNRTIKQLTIHILIRHNSLYSFSERSERSLFFQRSGLFQY